MNTNRLRQDLAGIPDLVVHVRQHVQHGTTTHDKISGTRNPAAPCNLDAIDAIDQLHTTITTWAARAAQTLNLTTKPSPNWRTIDRGVWVLLTHLDAIAEHDYYPRMADQISTQVATMHARWPTRERPQHLPTPCPNCDLLSLVRYAPTQQYLPITIACRSCGHVIPENLYNHHTRVITSTTNPEPPTL